MANRLGLDVNGSPRPVSKVIPLTGSGGLNADLMDLSGRHRIQQRAETSPAFFITTDSLTGDELMSMWNKVALTPNEVLVLKALQFLDLDIERIASQASIHGQTRGGFINQAQGMGAARSNREYGRRNVADARYGHRDYAMQRRCPPCR